MSTVHKNADYYETSGRWSMQRLYLNIGYFSFYSFLALALLSTSILWMYPKNQYPPITDYPEISGLWKDMSNASNSIRIHFENNEFSLSSSEVYNYGKLDLNSGVIFESADAKKVVLAKKQHLLFGAKINIWSQEFEIGQNQNSLFVRTYRIGKLKEVTVFERINEDQEEEVEDQEIEDQKMEDQEMEDQEMEDKKMDLTFWIYFLRTLSVVFFIAGCCFFYFDSNNREVITGQQ